MQLRITRHIKITVYNKKAIETGKKHFHAIYINWSYRIIGRVARIHKVLDLIIKVQKIRFIGEKKNKHVTTLKIKTLEYSAIKINAKRPPPYSTLNPETNSASPSGKSKGARLVSAKIEISHGINIGKRIKLSIDLILEKSTKEKDIVSIQRATMIKIILTS